MSAIQVALQVVALRDFSSPAVAMVQVAPAHQGMVMIAVSVKYPLCKTCLSPSKTVAQLTMRWQIRFCSKQGRMDVWSVIVSSWFSRSLDRPNFQDSCEPFLSATLVVSSGRGWLGVGRLMAQIGLGRHAVRVRPPLAVECPRCSSRFFF